MSTRHTFSLSALAAAAGLATTAVRSQAPGFEVALRDGSLVAVSGIVGRDAGRIALVQADGKRRDVALADVLALHGPAVVPSQLPAAHLRGGDVVRGAVAGGDSAGDFVELQSPVLLRLRLPVDRLELLLLREDLARPSDLRLPDGVDEALFQKAAVGFDLIAGTLHQFGEQGIRFQRQGDDAPRWVPFADLTALRIGDASPPKTTAETELITRTGDRLGVKVRAFAEDTVTVELEDGTALPLRAADVACLTFGAGVTFASALTPIAVEESGYGGDVLMPWQRDAAAAGGPLLAGGRTFGRGLGVHARSRITFRAPAGAAFFSTRVAVDDAVLALPVRADVDVRVAIGDKIVFERRGMHPGDAPASTGLLPVQPGDDVTLEADFGKGRDLGDRVDWLMPVFLPARAR